MNQKRKYPGSMRAFHWIMAILIFGQIYVGWYMTPWKNTDLINELYVWHKSFGLLIFLLVVLRLLNRWRSDPPELPESIPSLDRTLAHWAHRLIYVFIVLIPITGYILSSTYKYSSGITFFGIDIPELLPKNDTAFAIFDRMHAILAYTMLAVLTLHVAGVIKHRFFDKNPENDVLKRML